MQHAVVEGPVAEEQKSWFRGEADRCIGGGFGGSRNEV
jgi:hypothetical protein